MKIRFHKAQIEIECPEKELPFLEVCYRHNTPTNFSCRIGMCGTCRITILQGIENVSSKNEEEELLTRAPNERLGCQCSIKGDILIE